MKFSFRKRPQLTMTNISTNALKILEKGTFDIIDHK